MKFFLLFLLFITTGSPSVFAETPVAPAPVVAEITFPGVAEVIPSGARLLEDAVKAESKLVPLADLEGIKNEIAGIQVRQQELMQRITALGTPSAWSFDRLQELRGTLAGHLDALKKVLDTLSQRLNEADQIRKDWSDREDYWRKWQDALKNSHVDIPKGIFATSIKTCKGIIERAAQSSGPMVELQKTVTGLQSGPLEIQNQIDSELKSLRQQTFKKTTHSFVNPDFYRQFNLELWQSVFSGIAEVQHVKWEFLTDRVWLPALQILVVLALAGFIRHHRRAHVVTDEWEFIFHHPWATGVFVAIISLSLFYDNPPPLWKLGMSVLAASSAAILITRLLKNALKRFMIYLLTVLFLVTQVLHLIAFPAPLYRLYLTALCLLGLPLLWIVAIRNQTRHGGRVDSFTLTLRLGALVLLVALFSQITGYSNFSSRLIVSSVSTVFLSVFVTMTIRLGHGGIRFILTHPAIQQKVFFQRYGDQLLLRLSNVFKVFVASYAFLYLFVVWGIFDTVGEAWKVLVSKGMTVGEIEISLYMVVLVFLVLYFSISVSWFLRAILDAQVFPHRDLDRGVRDAIKKLLHYSLVFVGFLFAMSLAGVELKNFAVLAGAFSIGIGFGLQNIVNNFVSGIILLFERPVRVGDLIMIDGQWSTVRKIGLRSTVVETLNRAEIIVPNSDLISQQVTNWTLSSTVVRLVIPVGVAYGTNVPKVLNLLMEAAKTCKNVLEIPEPSPIFTAFGESSLDFELRVWVANADHLLTTRSEVLQYIVFRFEEENIEIPFPQRDLHLYLKEAKQLQELASATSFPDQNKT